MGSTRSRYQLSYINHFAVFRSLAFSHTTKPLFSVYVQPVVKFELHLPSAPETES